MQYLPDTRNKKQASVKVICYWFTLVTILEIIAVLVDIYSPINFAINLKTIISLLIGFFFGCIKVCGKYAKYDYNDTEYVKDVSKKNTCIAGIISHLNWFGVSTIDISPQLITDSRYLVAELGEEFEKYGFKYDKDNNKFVICETEILFYIANKRKNTYTQEFSNFIYKNYRQFKDGQQFDNIFLLGRFLPDKYSNYLTHITINIKNVATHFIELNSMIGRLNDFIKVKDVELLLIEQQNIKKYVDIKFSDDYCIHQLWILFTESPLDFDRYMNIVTNKLHDFVSRDYNQDFGSNLFKSVLKDEMLTKTILQNAIKEFQSIANSLPAECATQTDDIVDDTLQTSSVNNDIRVVINDENAASQHIPLLSDIKINPSGILF